MFLQLKDGALVNIFWLNNVYVDTEDTEDTKYIVIYEMVNGSKHKEVYDTEAEANTRKDSIIATLIK